MRTYKGVIYETGEKATFVSNGFWIGSKGRHITSYERTDVEDTKQYSRDKNNVFYTEMWD